MSFGFRIFFTFDGITIKKSPLSSLAASIPVNPARVGMGTQVAISF